MKVDNVNINSRYRRKEDFFKEYKIYNYDNQSIWTIDSDSGDYIFTNVNKADFERFIGYKISMRKICELIEEALEDKSLVNHGTYRVGTKGIRAIRIKKGFFK